MLLLPKMVRNAPLSGMVGYLRLIFVAYYLCCNIAKYFKIGKFANFMLNPSMKEF